MTVISMQNLGFAPKGRHTIRRVTPSNRSARLIEPWAIKSTPGTTLEKIEQAYVDALAAVDQVEVRRAEAKWSGKFTHAGVTADVRAFA